MNKDQGGGILERMIYGAILYVVMKYGPRFGFSSEDAAWIAGGGVAAVGSIYAWIHNRPASVLSRAGDTLPDSAHLVITTNSFASAADKAEVHALADSASSKVVAKTSPTTGL